MDTDGIKPTYKVGDYVFYRHPRSPFEARGIIAQKYFCTNTLHHLDYWEYLIVVQGSGTSIRISMEKHLELIK
jgi:hypothetical protein